MWVRGAAIRPVPAYAVVDRAVLDVIERELGESDDDGPTELDGTFDRFERTQPALARRAATVVAKPLDETALALGYFLTLTVWLAFDRAFGGRLAEITEDEVLAAESALDLEEELRAAHVDEPLELEDVMAIEQPGILAFIHEHVDAALDPTDADEAEREVDVEDVHAVYRLVLVMTLALSHAVASPTGSRTRELLA